MCSEPHVSTPKGLGTQAQPPVRDRGPRGPKSCASPSLFSASHQTAVIAVIHPRMQMKAAGLGEDRKLLLWQRGGRGRRPPWFPHLPTGRDADWSPLPAWLRPGCSELLSRPLLPGALLPVPSVTHLFSDFRHKVSAALVRTFRFLSDMLRDSGDLVLCGQCGPRFRKEVVRPCSSHVLSRDCH